MIWVDTHCHLNLPSYFPEPEATIAEAEAAGVRKLVVIGIDEPSSRLAVELASDHEGVFAVVGYHPTDVSGFQPRWLDAIRALAQSPKVKAIGEIGFDFYWDKSSREDQEAALLAQWDLAEELGLPVVYHCREAYDALLGLIERRGVKVPQLMHAFAGSMEQMQRAAALGCWFGVGGPITFKSAHVTREVAAEMPRDRVVLETDAPFLTPHPFRGKPNSPAKIPLVGEGLAAVWEISTEDCAATTTRAAEQLFGI